MLRDDGHDRGAGMGVVRGLLGTGSQGGAVTDWQVSGASPLRGQRVDTVITGEVRGGSSRCHEIGAGWFRGRFLYI